MNELFQLSDTDEYGTVLRIKDIELADELDDYLSEQCYVFLNQKFTSEYV